MKRVRLRITVPHCGLATFNDVSSRIACIDVILGLVPLPGMLA